MLEYARLPGSGRSSLVELTRPVAPGGNIILGDEDAARGQRVLEAGRRIRPAEIGLLAAFGQLTVQVVRRPWAAVLASGDEVVPMDQTPRKGQVRDLNSQAVRAAAVSAGARVRLLGRCPDDLEQLAGLIRSALADCEVLVITGGSSAGERDFTLKAFQAVAGTQILAHGAAVSPGKPLIAARQGRKVLLGLPGHPAGALVTAEIFLKEIIFRLTGLSRSFKAKVQARVTRPLPSAQGRRDYFRVRLREGPDGLAAEPILGRSGLISTLADADGLAICPEDQEGLPEGAWAEIHLLD
jgi:molybdopterin molybdotransferase